MWMHLAWLALCEGNPPVMGVFSVQRANNVTLWCFFAVGLNKLLNKQSSCQWFKTPWHSSGIVVMLWHCWSDSDGQLAGYYLEMNWAWETLESEYNSKLCYWFSSGLVVLGNFVTKYPELLLICLTNPSLIQILDQNVLAGMVMAFGIDIWHFNL